MYHSDIPLFADDAKTIMNSMSIGVHAFATGLNAVVVVEVPRWTNAKMEISKEESFNPIKQGEYGSLAWYPAQTY